MAHQIGHESGSAILQELLKWPPQEIATWALDQARELNQPGVALENRQLFQVASALPAAPLEQRQALIRGAIVGFGELPKQRRAEAVRLAMQTGTAFQANGGGNGFGPPQPASIVEASFPVQGKALSRSSDWSSPAGPSSPSYRSQPGRRVANGRQDDDHALPSPSVQNLVRVVRETKLEEMTKKELHAISEVAYSEIAKLVQPHELVDVVSELNEVEREQLTEALVTARVIPGEQRGFLEEAVRPGGCADKLQMTLSWLNSVYDFVWVALALPVLEMLVAFLLGLFGCGTPLITWLKLDAIIALLAATSIFIAGHILSPVYATLADDPVGAVQRWHTCEEDERWKRKLKIAVPDIEYRTYRHGAIGLGVGIVFILGGGAWAVLGALELLASIFVGCNIFTIVVAVCFIALRFAAVVALVLLVFYVLDELQEHRSRSPILGSSFISSMSDDDTPHDPLLAQHRHHCVASPPSNPQDFV